MKDTKRLGVNERKMKIPQKMEPEDGRKVKKEKDVKTREEVVISLQRWLSLCRGGYLYAEVG